MLDTANSTALIVSRLVIPALLLPAQIAHPQADHWLMRLYRAILEDALECLAGRGVPSSMGTRTPYERTRRRQEAWEWMVSDAEFCFSFRTVCAVLGLEVEAVRSQLRQRRWVAPHTAVSRQLRQPPSTDSRFQLGTVQ